MIFVTSVAMKNLELENGLLDSPDFTNLFGTTKGTEANPSTKAIIEEIVSECNRIEQKCLNLENDEVLKEFDIESDKTIGPEFHFSGDMSLKAKLLGLKGSASGQPMHMFEVGDDFRSRKLALSLFQMDWNDLEAYVGKQTGDGPNDIQIILPENAREKHARRPLLIIEKYEEFEEKRGSVQTKIPLQFLPCIFRTSKYERS